MRRIPFQVSIRILFILFWNIFYVFFGICKRYPTALTRTNPFQKHSLSNHWVCKREDERFNGPSLFTAVILSSLFSNQHEVYTCDHCRSWSKTCCWGHADIFPLLPSSRTFSFLSCIGYLMTAIFAFYFELFILYLVCSFVWHNLLPVQKSQIRFRHVNTHLCAKSF